MPIRLYVGNLPKELERQELEAVFAEYDDLVSIKVITDRKTGKCRGFGFVTVKTDEQADAIIEKFNGHVLKESTLKIEKAMPRAKGKGEAEPQSGNVAASGSANNNRRKGSGNKSRRHTASTPASEAAQPDPRWAQELEKLKELLAAQATNS
ncbi:MAG: RNA-binding protein [Cyanothece sp. SIO1E1]|nr:RNA-binding protein [Cyanothece sp. SIO1E1]